MWPETEWKKSQASHNYGEALWDPEMVRRMNQVATTIDTFGPEGGGLYMVVCFDGAIRVFRAPKYDPGRQVLNIAPVHAISLSQNIIPSGTFRPEGSFVSHDPEHLKSFSITVMDLPRHILMKECIGLENWDPWSKWIVEWKWGRWMKYSWWLKGLIYKHKDRMRHVDQIVCFALGSLQKNMEWVDKDTGVTGYKEFPRIFIQHMVPFTIRETIYEILEQESVKLPKGAKGQSRKIIPIVAQDPAYCHVCSAILKEHLDIETTYDFQGMIDIADKDKNSFVVTISPTNDLISMICDVTASFGGPLAMLCDEIELHQTSWNGTLIPGAPWLRWEGWYGRDPKNSSIYPSGDQTTKNMAQYVDRCRSDYFGDFTEKVGMRHSDFIPDQHEAAIEIKKRRLKFGPENDPDQPYPAAVEGTKGDKMYLDKYGSEYRDDLANAKAFWGKVCSSYFGDLQLYVRKGEISEC